MHRHTGLCSGLLSFRLAWPKRSRIGRTHRPAGRSRPGACRLELQPLERKLALATVGATSVAVPAAAIYAAGQDLVFNVVFSGPVTVVGTPRIDLTIGKAVRSATYLQGNGTNTLEFRYTVQSGDADTDGIAVAKAIRLPAGASIVDAGSVPTPLGIKPPSTKKVLVDSVAPKVQSVAGPTPKTYAAGSVLSFKVGFSENVSVTGSPTLPVDVGGTVRNAVWDGKGNRTKSLTFNVVIQAGDRDTDGVRIAGAIGLPMGAGIRDAAQNAVDPAVPTAFQAFPRATVDARGPSVVSFGGPTVTSKLVSVKVRFDEAVTVTGKPSIPFTLAGVPRQLAYATGSGKNELTFSYKPDKGVSPTAQNVVVSSLAIALNGGAIADKVRNAAASLAAPSDLRLSAASIAENNAIGAVVGAFSTTDSDGVRDRFTYSLVPGNGAGDNASFTIDGGQLRAGSIFNYESKSTYSIRVRSTDAGGLWIEKQFVISVTAVNTLRPSLSQMMAGTSESVVFRATFPAGESVNLYTSDQNGVVGSLLLPLYDDGQPIHADAVAGDGVFSNSLAVGLSSPGALWYVAQQGANSALASITVTPPLTTEELGQRAQVAADAQAAVDRAIGAGVSVAAALEAARTMVSGASNVDPASVELGAASVFWKTTEGVTYGVTVNSQGQRAATTTSSFGVTPPTIRSAPAFQAKGKAICLGVFPNEFEPFDEYDDVGTTLTNFGYDVTVRGSVFPVGVTIEEFKNLGQYDAVVISAHGDASASYGPVILTGQMTNSASDVLYKPLLQNGLLASVGGHYAITPRFITTYSGSMDGSIVYLSACRSTYTSAMANAFLGRGAAAVVGYTDYVRSDFSYARGIRMFNHLTSRDADGNLRTVGTIPGINVDTESDSDPALFRMITRDSNATLKTRERLLNDYDLYVEYKWGLNVRDLDTNTGFLGQSVGWSTSNNSPYEAWSGDDTSAGGRETVIVDLDSAFDASLWNGTTSVSLAAGWYIPAGGNGPAQLTVGLRKKSTLGVVDVISKSITPGAQSGPAGTSVGTITVNSRGEGDAAEVSFVLAAG